jgi:signal transduction histidine kinase/ligand-binding sensor domain-containing protein
MQARGPWLVWLGFFAFFGVQPANSLDQSAPQEGLSSEFQVDVWTAENGLPQNSITAIAQTIDGYLWLATFNGLARFDGVQFVNFDAANTPAFRLSRFVRLEAGADGSLWIISESHELIRFKDGVFTAFGAAEGVPRNGFVNAGHDNTGQIWFALKSGDGFFRFQNGRFIKMFAHLQIPEAGNSLYFDGASVWTPGDGELIRLDAPELKRVADPEKILGFGRDSKGRILAAGARAVYRLEPEAWRPIASFQEASFSPTALTEDRHGALWGVNWQGGIWNIGTNGIVRTMRLTRQRRPEALRCIFADQEGNLWIGSNGAGLYRLKARIIHTLTPEEGLSGNVVKSVTQDTAGNIWAMSTSTLNLISSNPARVMRTIQTTNNNWVLCGDREGYLWAGGFGSGMARRKNDFSERALVSGKVFEGICMAFHLDTAGALWAAGGFGLVRLNGIEVQKIRLPLEDMNQQPIHAIAQDRQGLFYLGTSGHGLWIGRDEDWREFRQSDGLPDNYVSALCTDANDAVWIGFPSHGLARYKNGKLFHFSPKGPWPAHSVYSIIQDDGAFLWFGSNQGLFRARRQELDDYADGNSKDLNVQRFTTSDGLTTSEFASGQQPVVCKARDGRLWFATVRGLAIVDPKAIIANTHPPPVIIEQLVVDDRALGLPSPLSEKPVMIDAGPERLEFHYTGLSFAAPEKMRFRVQFEGLDKDWVEMGARRSVHYSRVPPGAYRFRVTACNNDGVWNETGASMMMVIQPHYWQTPWFVGVLIAGALGLGYGIVLRTIGNLERQRAAQQEFSRRLLEVQELERKRMAGELHDSLGQKLQLIRNHAQLGLNRGAVPSTLHEISSITNDAISEVRAITAALRPSELDQIGLRGALEWMLESVAAASGLQIHFEVDPIDKLLSPANEMNLYRVVQETLNNIIKHARATEVTVEIKKSEGSLTVSIFDNGCGFDQSMPTHRRGSASGLGLAGIAERVRILGGTHTINSKIGTGTRLMATIPLTRP